MAGEFPGLFLKHYDADGKVVTPAAAVIAVEAESDVDLANNKEIGHPMFRCTIWSVTGGKFDRFLGEFSRWEPAQGKLLEALEKARRHRDRAVR